MATNLTSVEVAADTDATAAQYNALRDDILSNAGDAETSTGSADAYLLSVASEWVLAEFSKLKFSANFTNGGAATLNPNSEGAKNLKKFENGAIADLASGDIVSGSIIEVIYDGTQFIVVGGLNVTPTVGTPTGAMLIWTTDTAPTAHVLCDGAAISRTTFAALFAVIATTFGIGDGSTTFNVPDMRGRLPLGQDDMGGSSANRVTNTEADSLAGSEGAETHALLEAELPSHDHDFFTNASGNNNGVYGDANGGATDSGAGAQGTVQTATKGDGTAHENMPPYLTLNYIIKT